MADYWNDGLAGFTTDGGIDERDCSIVDMMDGEVTDWWDECWANGPTGLMARLRVG